jgi:hypothetical protein
MELPNMLHVESGSASSIDGCERLDEMAAFGDGVDYNHDCIISVRLREFHDEVDTDSAPAFIWNWKGMELTGW